MNAQTRDPVALKVPEKILKERRENIYRTRWRTKPAAAPCAGFRRPPAVCAVSKDVPKSSKRGWFFPSVTRAAVKPTGPQHLPTETTSSP